jgi:hypothetical protein
MFLSSAKKMEGTGSSEELIKLHQTSRLYLTKDTAMRPSMGRQNIFSYR